MFSDEDIAFMEDVASGKVFEPSEEEAEQAESVAGDDSGEAELLHEDEAEEQGLEGDDSKDEEAETASETKRSKMMPRARFDEVNERMKQAEARSQELEFKLNQQAAAFEKILAKMNGETQEAEADDEILDEALAKKMDERFNKLNEATITQAINNDVALARQSVPDIDNAYQYLLAASAHRIMQRAEFAGHKMSEVDAINYAQKLVNDDLKTIKQNNPSANVGSYLYIEAQNMGYQTSAGQKAQPNVNMKAVQKARQQAGAPAIDKESVSVGINDAIQKEYKKLKESGMDADYLAKWGIV